MPCMDGGPSTNWYAEYVKMGRLLCKACRIIAKHKLEGKMPASLAAWWMAHQEEDRKRLEREAEEAAADKIRQTALNKLTEEEIKALNLRVKVKQPSKPSRDSAVKPVLKKKERL